MPADRRDLTSVLTDYLLGMCPVTFRLPLTRQAEGSQWCSRHFRGFGERALWKGAFLPGAQPATRLLLSSFPRRQPLETSFLCILPSAE